MDKECADNDLSKGDLQRYSNVIRLECTLATTEVPVEEDCVDGDGHGDDVDDGGVALGDFSTAR